MIYVGLYVLLGYLMMFLDGLSDAITPDSEWRIWARFAVWPVYLVFTGPQMFYLIGRIMRGRR